MIFQTLDTLTDALALIKGVNSCEIGIEGNISPECYPLIRVVPLRMIPGRPYDNRTIDTGIWFGVPVTESEGLRYAYESLLLLEAEVIKVIKANNGRYIETITDDTTQDRLETYRMMFIRCELESSRPVVS